MRIYETYLTQGMSVLTRHRMGRGRTRSNSGLFTNTPPHYKYITVASTIVTRRIVVDVTLEIFLSVEGRVNVPVDGFISTMSISIMLRNTVCVHKVM